MQTDMSEQLYRAAGGIGFLVGVLALLFPRTLLKVYRVQEELTGPGIFGWRLFAIRNIFVGAQAVAGSSIVAAEAMRNCLRFMDRLQGARAMRRGGAASRPLAHRMPLARWSSRT